MHKLCVKYHDTCQLYGYQDKKQLITAQPYRQHPQHQEFPNKQSSKQQHHQSMPEMSMKSHHYHSVVILQG